MLLHLNKKMELKLKFKVKSIFHKDIHLNTIH
jgi:hypothetical protein